MNKSNHKKFAFIGHPVDLNHLYILLGFWGWFAKLLPRAMLYKILLRLPPYKYCSFKKLMSKTGATASGWTIICPLLPQQVAFLKEEDVIKKVIQAVELAEKMGAEMAILGGFTSIVGNEGEVISRHSSIAVTSGNTYTACLAIEGIEKASKEMDLDLKQAIIAIIGATGDIGSICTKIFSRKVRKINIAARNERKLNIFADNIKRQGTCQVEVFKYTRDAVREADIILTVTSAVSVLIKPEDIKPGTIICDVAIPANIAKEIVNMRDDVLVFEGGLSKPPFEVNIKGKAKKAMPPKSIFGCLSEGMLLALEGKFENYSIGRGNITEQKIAEMFEIERKHGFSVADFFCGYKIFSKEDIKCIKRNAIRKKEGVNFAAK
ncbi:MAG: shikimate dehydrogenase [Candidatus Omnitrophica bacterium]|nr:shikimate dehydrogenase [Candidatus Omnitrophota bacterium]